MVASSSGSCVYSQVNLSVDGVPDQSIRDSVMNSYGRLIFSRKLGLLWRLV